MEKFKNQLQLKINYLTSLIQSIEKKQKEALGDSLRISVDNHYVRYYHQIKQNNKRQEEYISRKNIDLARKLAQEKYDSQVLKCAKKQLKQLEDLAARYNEDEIKQIYYNTRDERRTLIIPVEAEWEDQVKLWCSEEYEAKGFDENDPLILSENGVRVRSKSEKIIADYFERNNIPYKYEHPLYLKPYGWIYPDFNLLSAKTGKDVYWEHAGKMDDSEYVNRFIKKIHLYERNNIFPGEQLIITFETKQQLIQTDEIKNLLKRYIL